MWHHVLARLPELVGIVAIDHRSGRPSRLLARGPHVVLADGHADLPSTAAPLVVCVHEAGWFEDQLRATLDPAFYELISTRTAAAVGAASLVLTPSQAIRRDVTRAYGLQPESVRAVPYGLDPVFRPDAPGGRAAVAGLRGGVDAPYVLYAAALHPRKNLAVLRQAMADLAAEGLPHLLVVAGGPAGDRHDSSALELAARAELPGAPGRVVRVPSPGDRELSALMAGASAFCLPSLYEGFGLTALEAMGCGAPVVVSDRGSLPEVVGDAGLVVAPTVDAVRDALREVLLDAGLAQRLARAGRRRAGGFTWQATARGWLAALSSAAAAELG